eukprot:scaffold223210_cov32-Tisochrysis_lutea.AAC.1
MGYHVGKPLAPATNTGSSLSPRRKSVPWRWSSTGSSSESESRCARPPTAPRCRALEALCTSESEASGRSASEKEAPGVTGGGAPFVRPERARHGERSALPRWAAAAANRIAGAAPPMSVHSAAPTSR